MKTSLLHNLVTVFGQTIFLYFSTVRSEIAILKISYFSASIYSYCYFCLLTKIDVWPIPTTQWQPKNQTLIWHNKKMMICDLHWLFSGQKIHLFAYHNVENVTQSCFPSWKKRQQRNKTMGRNFKFDLKKVFREMSSSLC